MQRDELADWLRLVHTPGLGPVGIRRLLGAFGLPGAVLSAHLDDLSAVIGSRLAAALQAPPPEYALILQTTLDWLEGAGHRRVLALGDPDYPAGLLQTEDPPALLYVMGTARTLPPAEAALAIVGSRNPTPQGAINARAFAQSLGEAGLCIVSGLALGVDAAAHEGALQAASACGCRTVAVVGTGLDRVYPRQHHALAQRIALHGMLVSEYPLGTAPLAANFPRRNRIISALSRGTLVVEAALQSGSLVTARCAVEQGREVFAIPGSIHSAQSRGCHALIRQGAKLVESAADVLEEFSWAPPAGAVAMRAATPEHPLLGALGQDPVTLDQLGQRTGMDSAALQAALLELELAGAVARLAGARYQRLIRA